MKSINFTINEEQANSRIDKFLSEALSDYSRSHIQRLIKEQTVLVNNKVVKANYKININDQIIIHIPDPKVLDIPVQDLSLDIVYEDKDILVINKPQDMVVHPAAGHYEDTLVNGILFHCQDDLSGINGVMRPGVVHRIDKNTSGLIVICKNDKSHAFIAEQFKVHSVSRKYEAIVYNNIKEDSGSIDLPIGRHPIQRKQMAINYKNGKRAVTHFKVMNRLKGNKFTHVELQLETGRTHQIRVHMTSIHHPLVGDDVYGPKKSLFKLLGQVLHARTLGFIHPTTLEYIEFKSELPNYFKQLLEKLK